MATFSSVTRSHILQALAEYDARGGEEFLDVYGFLPADDYPMRHEGRSYDSRAVLGVAHRFATGRLATLEDFRGGMGDAIAILLRRGFDVAQPGPAFRAAPPRAARSPRTPRTPVARASAPREAAPALCPTCSMTLPATGVCDYCS